MNDYKSTLQEGWECPKCGAINNVQECIKEYHSKCVGCEDKCYIEFQTERMMYSKLQTNNGIIIIQYR